MSDAAIATIVTGLVTITTMVCGVVTLWIKLRETAQKVDDNTELTVVATHNATKAAVAASVAATKTDGLVQQVNGEMDNKIRAIVKESIDPVIKSLNELRDQVARNSAILMGKK